MTQIILQNSIDNMQMNVLMGLFNSWNVNVKTDTSMTQNVIRILYIIFINANEGYTIYETN